MNKSKLLFKVIYDPQDGIIRSVMGGSLISWTVKEFSKLFHKSHKDTLTLKQFIKLRRNNAK